MEQIRDMSWPMAIDIAQTKEKPYIQHDDYLCILIKNNVQYACIDILRNYVGWKYCENVVRIIIEFVKIWRFVGSYYEFDRRVDALPSFPSSSFLFRTSSMTSYIDYTSKFQYQKFGQLLCYFFKLLINWLQFLFSNNSITMLTILKV